MSNENTLEKQRRSASYWIILDIIVLFFQVPEALTGNAVAAFLTGCFTILFIFQGAWIIRLWHRRQKQEKFNDNW